MKIEIPNIMSAAALVGTLSLIVFMIYFIPVLKQLRQTLQSIEATSRDYQTIAKQVDKILKDVDGTVEEVNQITLHLKQTYHDMFQKILHLVSRNITKS